MRITYEVAKKISEWRDYKPTPEEREEQRKSFAFGNTKISNPDITREMIDEAAERLKGKEDA